jgi:hypothetical protein
MPLEPKRKYLANQTLTNRLGSVAGPVIQATGRSEFEDGYCRVPLCRATHIT